MKMPEILESIPLAPLTTIRLGGNAQFYAIATNTAEILALLDFANEKAIPVHILGGGSNTLFSDAGFKGLVIHVQIKGMETLSETETTTTIRVGAGENWDAFVRFSVEHDLAGIEALIGIPGYVGGTPVQNVGAYGQEVANTITAVHAIDRQTKEEILFPASECGFGYRKSRFKFEDANKYIITHVDFALAKSSEPVANYPQLNEALEKAGGLAGLNRKEALEKVMQTVLALRKAKSMVIDENDENTRSCGSFFTNPFITSEHFEQVLQKTGLKKGQIPHYRTDTGVKIPAAWILEFVGFKKGYTKGLVGLSQNHTLALVNRGGTTADILALQEEIQSKVNKIFDIHLEREPVLVE